LQLQLLMAGACLMLGSQQALLWLWGRGSGDGYEGLLPGGKIIWLLFVWLGDSKVCMWFALQPTETGTQKNQFEMLLETPLNSLRHSQKESTLQGLHRLLSVRVTRRVGGPN
jgi:hypothetical protein